MPLINTTAYRIPAVEGWTLAGPPVYDSVSYNPTTPGAGVGVEFSQDGTKMYFTDEDTQLIYQRTLSTPWLMSSAGSATSLDVSSPDGDPLRPSTVAFKTDGTKMFVTGTNDGNGFCRVYEYALSSAWDVTSETYSTSFTTASYDANMGIYFKPDGSKVYMTRTLTGPSTETNDILQYTLSTPWLISSAGSLVTKNLSSVQPLDVAVNPDGDRLFWLSNVGIVYQWAMTAWTLSTAASNISFDVSSQATNYATSVAWKHDDGTKMYIHDQAYANGTVYQYTTTA